MNIHKNKGFAPIVITGIILVVALIVLGAVFYGDRIVNFITGAAVNTPENLTTNLSNTNSSNISIDTTAPSVVSVSPANGVIDVNPTAQIKVLFSEPMNSSTINENSFFVRQGENIIVGTISYSETTAVFIPTNTLDSFTTYKVTVTIDAKDLAGNAIVNNYSWSFITTSRSSGGGGGGGGSAAPGDTTAPTINSVVLTDNSSNVQIESTIKVLFSEPINALTINTSTITLKTANLQIAGEVNYGTNGVAVVFKPIKPLSFNTTYTFTISNKVKDLAGNPLAGDYVFNFITVSSPEMNIINAENKTISWISPFGCFALQVKHSLIGQNWSNIREPISFNFTNWINKVTLNDSSGMSFYRLVQIQEPCDTTSPAISLTNPKDNAANVPLNSAITARFNEGINSLTANNNTFKLSCNNAAVKGTVETSYKGLIISFTPTVNLTGNVACTATLTKEIRDIAGNPLENDYTWQFDTENRMFEENSTISLIN